MTSSTKEEEDLHNLELESHYLSRALSKLKPNSPEWSFLQKKLDAVEEVMRSNNQDDSVYPPPPPPPLSQQQEPSPYVDDSGKRYDVPANNNNIGGYRDVPSYADDIPYVDDDEPYYDDNEPYTQETSDRSALYPSSNNSYAKSGNSSPNNNNSDNTPLTNKWTNPRKQIMALTVVMMVGILLLFPLLLNKTSNSAGIDALDNNGKEKNPVVITEPCASFSFHLIPDQFGNETSWMIVQYSKNNNDNNNDDGATETGDDTTSISKEIEILSGGPYSYKKGFESNKVAGGSHYEMIHATTCLPVGSYAFILYDAKGDGICCAYGSGEYGINLSKGKTIRPLSSGAFVGTQEITPFEVIEEDIDVFPTKTMPEIFESSSEIIPNPIDGVLETNDEDEITEPCASFTMHLIPDQFGNETTWMIMRFDGIGMATLRDSYDPQLGIAMLDGGPYLYKKEFDRDAIGSHYEMIEATACLPVGLYTFTLYDAKGDGICCEYGRGEYGINLSKGRVIRPLSLGKFSGTSQVTPFQVTTDDIDVLPPIASTTSDTASLALPSSIDPDNYEASTPCASFSMHLVPDQFGNETTWKLYEWDDADIKPKADIPGSKGKGDSRFLLREIAISRREKESKVKSLLALEGGPYSYQEDFDKEEIGSHYNAIIAETCLPVGSYKFMLYDAEEDGICCEYGRGEYGIDLSKGRVIRPLSQGKFQGASQVTMFKVTAEDIDVFPPLSSSSTETSFVANNQPPSDESIPSGANTDTDMMVSPGKQSDTISTFDTVGQKDSYTDIISAAVNNVGTNSVNSPASVSSPSSVSSLSSLVTVEGDDSTDTRAKAYGILFDIEANPGVSTLIISGMDLYLDTNALTHYEVWSKVGSWQDVNDANPDYFQGFSRVSHGSVSGKGSLDFTKIALGDFHDVEILGGQRQAFWVTLSDDNLVFSNFEGEGISRHELASGLVLKANEAMDVFYGAAVRAYPLELADPVTDFWYNAGFLGRLWYKDNSNA